MEIISIILVASQLFFTIVAGFYFYFNLKAQKGCKVNNKPEYRKEAERLYRLRTVKLTEPLSEKIRPSELNQIIGQEKGINALRAALCGENPQHILIYGPPGVGKTAAARIILEEAKNSKNSPFKQNAKFIEIDATTLQFDERSFADPLIGSVHDPIYQGAGAFGSMGIPQPKEGAVTKAHGGVLFIDEIGELQPIQMNKLLKVLEDRKVFLTSSYYNPDDKNMPSYIKSIFESGLPADFRLIGATTRSPEEIPMALRSRCTEIYFRDLKPNEIKLICENACKSLKIGYTEKVLNLATKYCESGRTAVNLIQTATSFAKNDNRDEINISDVEEVIQIGKYHPRIENKIKDKPKIGYVNGMAVYGYGKGIMMGIEAVARKTELNEKASLKVTGIVEEEEMKTREKSFKRNSMARGSIDNVITVLKNITGIESEKFNIHINFLGGTAVDGPSAGITVFTALYSAILGLEVSNKIAMTGEISIKGNVLPVGGVREKLEACIEAGVEVAIIPKENMQKEFEVMPIKVIPVENIFEVIDLIFKYKPEETSEIFTA